MPNRTPITDRCELVHSAAQIALAADGQALDPEHIALQRICSALGMTLER